MAAPKVYDWQSNQWMLVPDHEVTQGVASGRYSFEEGLDVPVISPSGEYGTMPSQHVQDAFSKGKYRWATDEDLKAWQGRQQEQSKEAIYGDQTPLATGLGFVQGMVPGANTIMEGMGALSGHGADVQQGIKEVGQRNEGATLTGNILGTISPYSVGGALAGKIGGAAEGLAANALSKTASGIVEKMGSKAFGSAMETAYFGLHNATNEAALGDPGEVAETLMAGLGRDLILGGAFGAGLEGARLAAPAFKKLFTGSMDALSAASEKAAEASAKGVILPTLSRDVKEGMASAIDDKAARDLYFFGGGKEAIEKTQSELASTASEVESQARALKGELNYSIKGAPKELQGRVNEAITSAGGDLFQATEGLYADHAGQRLALNSAMDRSVNPGTIFEGVDKNTDRLIKTLERYGDSGAKAKAGEIETFINAQKVSVGLPRVYDDASAYEALMNSGKEAQVAMELRERAMAGLDKLPERAQGMVKNYVDKLTEALHDHPEFGADIRSMDSKYAALNKLRDFVSEKTGGFTNSIVGKLKADPEYAAEFDAIMKRFPDVAPQLQAFQKSLGDAMQEQVHLNQIRQSIRDAGVKSYGRMGPDDFIEIAKSMGRQDLGLKAERLKALQNTLIDQNAGPFTKYSAYLRALGRDVPESMMKFEQGQNTLLKLHELSGKASDGSFLENLLAKGARGTIKSAVMGAASSAIGSAVGHTMLAGPVGYAAGAIGGAMVKRALNPASTLETLTRLERGINKSYRALDSAFTAAVDGLTSNAATKTGTLAGIGYTNDLAARKDSYKTRSDYLTQLQDPQFRANEAERRIGNAEGAPNITAAMHGQYSRGINFLATKAPVDPLAHQSLISDKTGWKPSDMELAKYERYVDAVENPTAALANIARGRVSSEEVETLKTVYPAIFQQLQDKVLDAIMKPDLKLSYQQRMQIGTLFSMPTDVSLRPNFISSMQQHLQNQATKFKGSGPGSTPPQSPTATANQSETERITFK